jgi:hypothetical protein
MDSEFRIKRDTHSKEEQEIIFDKEGYACFPGETEA